MIVSTLAQAAWSHVVHGVDTVSQAVAVFAPTPAPDEPGINTNGILGFIASKIAPILLAVLGVIFISRAGKGEVSRVLTSSAIALVGLAFIAGAATLLAFGEDLVGLVFE